MVMLSKSKYMAGLGCPRLLWCIFNAPEMIPPVDESTQALFDQGHEVGDFAKKVYPGGVEVDWEKGFDSALRQTEQLVKQRMIIFEASFAHKNACCRTDILVPVPGSKSWDIIEVKSSSEVKDEHIHDVAFQQYCLEGAGLNIRRCHLMHINNEYVRKGKIAPNELFICENITGQATEMLPGVEESINEMVLTIKSPSMPEPELGTECVDPKACCVCLNDLPEHNVTELYRMGKKAFHLLNQKVVLIKDLPRDFQLNEKQQIQKDCVIRNRTHKDAGAIRKFLSQLRYPVYFLDFETINPAIPLFDGTRPYQKIPFQVSLHTIKEPGASPDHTGFLTESPEDPRPGVIKILKNIGAKGTILTYNVGFEKGIIQDLAEAFHEEKWLSAIIDRLDDLIIPFKSFWYYSPAQRGSCSLKNVLPALTGKSYAGLDISDGGQAAREFFAMMYKGGKGDKAALRKALLIYCRQDTQGMADILRVLEKASE